MALSFFKRGSLKGEKSTLKTSLSSSITPSSALRILLRFLQALFAIVVIGLYAQDLNRAHKAGVGYDSKWMFATITGALSAFFALLCMLPLIKAWFLFGVDFVLWVLWLAVFGTFGSMYIKEDPEGNGGIQRMKNAVWIDLICMLLWFFSTVYGAVIFWKHRKARTVHTGRAASHV